MKRYESAIRVISAFFAVLLGFGLRKILDGQTFTPPEAQWPCFFLSVLLFLRLLLGSSNHMWFEFVRPDLKADSTWTASKLQVMNDFLFLVAFGLIGVAICYSHGLPMFLNLNILLAALGIVWAVGYEVLAWLSVQYFRGKKRIPAGKWGFWLGINLAQLASLLLVKHGLIPAGLGVVKPWPDFMPGPPWEWSLAILTLLYFVILIVDLVCQLNVLAGNPPPAAAVADNAPTVAPEAAPVMAPAAAPAAPAASGAAPGVTLPAEKAPAAQVPAAAAAGLKPAGTI
jgi:hypothetical protein